MINSYERVSKVVFQCLADEGIQAQTEQPEDIKFLGRDAVCDSLGLVRYLLAVEEGIVAEFDTNIVIMDERAMSQSRSPFRNLATLIDYIVEALQ